MEFLQNRRAKWRKREPPRKSFLNSNFFAKNHPLMAISHHSHPHRHNQHPHHPLNTSGLVAMATTNITSSSPSPSSGHSSSLMVIQFRLSDCLLIIMNNVWLIMIISLVRMSMVQQQQSCRIHHQQLVHIIIQVVLMYHQRM